jgi:hypothetical protein
VRGRHCLPTPYTDLSERLQSTYKQCIDSPSFQLLRPPSVSVAVVVSCRLHQPRMQQRPVPYSSELQSTLLSSGLLLIVPKHIRAGVGAIHGLLLLRGACGAALHRVQHADDEHSSSDVSITAVWLSSSWLLQLAAV